MLKHHTINLYTGTGSKAPSIFKFGTKWGGGVNWITSAPVALTPGVHWIVG
jgi:hypothetical protein